MQREGGVNHRVAQTSIYLEGGPTLVKVVLSIEFLGNGLVERVKEAE